MLCGGGITITGRMAEAIPSRFPCLTQVGGIPAAARPEDWPSRSFGPWHPQGFADWLSDLPECRDLRIKQGWFTQPGQWISLAGTHAGNVTHLDLPAPASIAESIYHPEITTAFRLFHPGVGNEGYFIERWGPSILIHLMSDSQNISQSLQSKMERFLEMPGVASASIQKWEKAVRGVDKGSLNPQFYRGKPVDNHFEVFENRLKYSIRYDQGLSVGLFLDHRDNRRRWCDRFIEPGWEIPSSGELLNTFAYTCGFSLAAASSGWRTTSLDLSQKYLEWGKDNFRLNQIDPEHHDFVYGDSMDWMSRWRKKGRKFDAIILDPPTFSKSSNKKGKVFRAMKDFGSLAALAGAILNRGGIILASTNAREMSPSGFLSQLESGLADSGHAIRCSKFAGQGIDFPIPNSTMPHLKSFWIQTGP